MGGIGGFVSLMYKMEWWKKGTYTCIQSGATRWRQGALKKRSRWKQRSAYFNGPSHSVKCL